jgi:ABC-2 type transport system permease protein
MRAFRTLTATELRLFLRDRGAVLFSFGLPTLVLLLLGAISALREPTEFLDGQRFVDYFVPSLLAMSVALLGVQVLPTGLATYREKGILRRLSATPARPFTLLVAQLVINIGAAVVATALMVLVARVILGTPLPAHPVGFMAAFLLGTAAVFAVGLVIAAIAPRARTATGIGTIAFLLVMFFAGVYLPKFLLPDVVLRIGEYVPPGVTAMDDAWHGAGPQPTQLIAMAAVAVGASLLAARLFRWE